MIPFSDQDDDCSLEMDDQKPDLNLDKQNKNDQMEESVKQHKHVEASQTDMNNRQIAVTSGFKLNDTGTYSLSVCINISKLST